ncbi:hypothetical protein CsSME_00053362 [Camellia sinensis var. sinensis]
MIFWFFTHRAFQIQYSFPVHTEMLLGVQPTMEDQHDANAKASREISSTSVFVNSEPMREEQVQNAVKFLSHPKVRGSPVIYRRSFLEKKGLTKEEIDEAFRRVIHPRMFQVCSLLVLIKMAK